MDFALSEIDTKTGAEEGAVVQLLRLDGSPLLNAKKQPVTVTILGADSNVYQRLQRNLGRTRLTRLQQNRGNLATDEELDRQIIEDIDLLAKVTTAWSGVLDTSGKEVPFSFEAATEVYTKYPVAREQAEKAIGERTRFIRPS